MRQGATLPDRLQHAATTQPDEVALGAHDGDALTFHGWERRSGALARGLRRLGIGAGDRVALLFDAARWADFAVACLAVHKATAVAVPVGATLVDLEQRRVLEHADPAALVAPAELAPAGLELPVPSPEQLEADGADDPLHAPPDPAALAEICYRSRPLTRPAPVPRCHRRLLASPWASLRLGESTRSLIHAFPLGTAEAQNALWASLGPEPVTVRPLAALDLDRLCSAGAAAASAACALPPTAVEALLGAGAATDRDWSWLRALIVSSGRVTGDLLVRLTAALPEATLRLIDVLGEPGTARDAFAHDRDRPGALGRPLGSTTVWAGDHAGRSLDPGQLGCLWLAARDGGAPAATDAVGYRDETGAVYTVTSEADTVRRRGGSTLSRAEIAGVLRARSDVADAVVLGTPGDGAADELVAAVVPRPSPDPAGPAPAELQAFVAHHLGTDKRPDTVAITDSVPRNHAGIVLWDRLRRQLDLPSADTDAGSDAPDPPPGPVDDVDSTLGRMWQRVLGVEPAGGEQDFFEVGGGWFEVAKLLDLVAAAFGLRVSLSAFLAAPTVTGLAAAVRRQRSDVADDRHGPEPTEPDEGGEPRQAPVAASQQGMLWHERFAPGCQNLPGLARRFRGPLDLAVLERALDEIVRRQEALRTTFEVRDGEPRQVVHPHRPRPLLVQDLSHLAADERHRRVQQTIADAGARPHDLVSGPLFEPTVLRLDDQDHVLVIRTHHSVFDDWSVGVFRRELSALYAAYADGRPSPLPEPPVQLADFARDQHCRLAGPRGARELAFWRQELAGAPLTTQLPIDDPDRPEGSPQPAGEPVTVTLPTEVRTGVHRVARSERATLFMTMLAAFAVLVQRYTGQQDLVLATVVAHRNRTELEGLVGCFTKKVPLRLRLDDDPTFTEALARTRKALLGALGHQDLAFEDVVQDALGSAAATHGLVPHLPLVFQGVTPQAELDVPGVDSAGFETSSTTTRAHFMAGADEPDGAGGDGGDGGGSASVGEHDGGVAASEEDASTPWGDGLYLGTFLILSVHDADDQLSCLARGAYHVPAARALLTRLHTLLTDIAADPDRPVSTLTLLDAEARDEVAALGQGPAIPSPDRTLLGALRAQVAQRAHEVAVSTPTEAMTYAELDARSTRLARRLRANGAGRGARVGVALEPSTELVVAVLAAWKAGAAWLALDPREPDEDLARIVDDAAPVAIVATDARGRLSHHAPVVTPASGASLRPEAARETDHPVLGDIGGSDDAVMVHGSGATRRSVGVVLSHGALATLEARLGHALDDEGGRPSDRVALCNPATHDGFVRQLARLLTGQRLHVPDGTHHRDPRQTVALVGAGAVDVVDGTPEELDALRRAGLAEALRHRRPEWVEPLLVVGAREAMGADRWRAFGNLGRARVVALYGPPECGFAATAHRPVRTTDRADAGRPLPGVTAHVLDAHGQPVPDRALGELHLGDHAPTAGSLDGREPNSEGTAPGAAHHPPAGLWPTGQRARRLPDGRVELLGPLATTDLRGFRVDAPRVARALADAPGVARATVTVEADDRGDSHLVASVASDGPPPTLSEVRTHLWARLPGYAWPARVVRSPEHAASTSSATDRSSSSPQLPSPRVSTSSQAITRAWADVLRVPDVADGANYWQAFSFLEALARARDTGVTVPARTVTRHRTVGALALTLLAPGQNEKPQDLRSEQ